MTSPEGQVREATKSAYNASIPNKKGWELLNERDPAAADRTSNTEPGATGIPSALLGRLRVRLPGSRSR